jgi:hypothetical protein
MASKDSQSISLPYKEGQNLEQSIANRTIGGDAWQTAGQRSEGNGKES